MKRYVLTTQFVIGDDEDILKVADAWLKETSKEYDHPSRQFDIKQTITIRSSNDKEKHP
jgi:hypothetical protein